MKHIWGKWIKETRAVAAVEFSLVGVPFVLMTIGIVEMALMFTAQSVLQEATFTASRLIRTGQLQQGKMGDPEQAFRDSVCDFARLLIPCGSIQFAVQKLEDFSAADDADPVFDEDGNLQSTPFDPGGENDVVLIRVVYNYPIRTPVMQQVMSTVGGTKRGLMSTIILQTEPYSPLE
ncbi:MAG TPA: TadE/TadG family type IV pilus assembly protein [Micavibrio sp.]|nr:TadE/TadG family type IV pilus assembly protein [Micavibrio sp.]